MNIQPPLFDDPGVASKPLRRRSDPETSREGAESAHATLSETKATALRIAACHSERDFTAQELAVLANQACPRRSIESYRKRFHELARSGQLKKTTRRTCCITGNPAMAFQSKGDGSES